MVMIFPVVYGHTTEAFQYEFLSTVSLYVKKKKSQQEGQIVNIHDTYCRW